MSLSTIRKLYNILKTSDNISVIRANLHRNCDNLNFDKLIQSYISFDEIIMMIKFIQKEYISMVEAEKTIYKISDEELENRIYKLKQLDEIFKSYSNPYVRFDKISKLFRNPSIMHKSYHLLIKYGQDDPKLDEIRPILNNFETYYLEYKKYFKNGIDKSVSVAYLDNSSTETNKYVEFIAKRYIADSDSYLIDLFLNRYNINKSIFEYYISIIKKHNKPLYYEYVLKKQENDIKIRNINKGIIEDLCYAIKEGQFIYGNSFDILDFIKLVPFRDSKNFIEDLDNFMIINNMLSRNIIIQYIKDNKLDKKDELTELSIEKLKSQKVIIDNVVFDEKVLDIIINYLIDRGIPICKASLRETGKKYLNNELKFFNSNFQGTKKRVKPIIIP